MRPYPSLLFLLCLLGLAGRACHAQAVTQAPPQDPVSPIPSATLPPAATTPSPVAPVSAPTLSRPRRFRFVLGAPTPDLRGFGIFGGGYGRRSMQMQFPFLLDATLGNNATWGRTYLVSDNLVSTDRFDGASRLAVRLGMERPLQTEGVAMTSEVRYTSNQSGTRQALSASIGTWVPVGPRLWGQRSALGLDLLRFETRAQRYEDRNPSHFARNALIPTMKLRLPPLFLRTAGGKGDVNRHPHLTLGADAWYFANEEAAAGYSPRHWESNVALGLIVPESALGIHLPVVKALAFSYVHGANEANGYANISNFRTNLILGSWEEIRPVGRLSKQFKLKAEAARLSLWRALTTAPHPVARRPRPSLLDNLMNTNRSLYP